VSKWAYEYVEYYGGGKAPLIFTASLAMYFTAAGDRRSSGTGRPIFSFIFFLETINAKE
jgi:hypothetical protein